MQILTDALEVQASNTVNHNVKSDDIVKIIGTNGFATSCLIMHSSRYIHPKLHLRIRASLIRPGADFGKKFRLSSNEKKPTAEGMHTLG